MTGSLPAVTPPAKAQPHPLTKSWRAKRSHPSSKSPVAETDAKNPQMTQMNADEKTTYTNPR
jgi:hypothetical protein